MQSRIERRGGVAPSTPRFMRFLIEAMGGVALDDVQDPGQMRPDFSCLRGLLAVEIKSLEGDASQRIANLTEELEKREDWPEFLGAWPIDSVIRNMDEPDLVRRKISDRIGRAIVSHLRKANKQLAAHSSEFSRTSQVRLVVLINEDHEVYDPPTTVNILQKALSRFENGKPLYEHIDAVLYLTERHASQNNRNIVFPMITITGPSLDHSPWKGNVLDFVGWKWCRWTGARYLEAAPEDVGAFFNSFSTIEHIPDQMRRQDTWSLSYRRNPYMRLWSYEKLRDHWDDVIVVGMFAFLKDSPIKLSKTEIARFLEQFTHLMDEIAHRGLPMIKFKSEPERVKNAAKRIGLPPAGVTWIAEFLSGKEPQNDVDKSAS